MLKRQRSGSVLCTSCGVLVAVNDATCYNCGRRNPGLWGWAPALRALGHDVGFMPFIVGACGVIYVLSLAISGGSFGGMLSPSGPVLNYLGNSGAVPVFIQGRWLTLLSAGWLHGNILHIVFNMMWVRQLVPATADLYGPGRTVIIYTVSSVSGFLLSSTIGFFLPGLPFFGASYTVGASAAIFGLLGAVVYYGRRSGSRAASSQAWSYALTAGAMGFIMSGVDNSAHIGGFAGGYFAGRLLDPLKPERIDHIFTAMVCLLASMVSIMPQIVAAIIAVLS
ncbi:MAG TPA: rhomboid family intramembrane serine protease [Vicinamibacterales bacterium]|nr:rhomboid family intramembrane serine protease [Vicinamibacterales bacterium]